jgi:hypothetical protein
VFPIQYVEYSSSLWMPFRKPEPLCY